MAEMGWQIVYVTLGIATTMLNEERGHCGVFWWGLLGAIGLIVILMRKEGNTNSCSEMSKYDNPTPISTSVQNPKPKTKPEDEMVNLKKLKAYKELLDSGIITQEDYDTKIAELL